MAQRKGMMKGKGRGYKNVIGKDPMVHSQSARGIKQPQRISPMVAREKKETWDEFNKSDFRLEINRYTNEKSGFTFNNDFFSRFWFKAFPLNRNVTYMHEWANRFMRGTPTTYMDIQRRKAYKETMDLW